MTPAEQKNTAAVITRTKDSVLLLERAINSVLYQTFTNWTHVIVNGGGNRTVLNELLSKYEAHYAGRLQVISHEVPLGMEAASNVGIKKSDSKYLLIHDDVASGRWREMVDHNIPARLLHAS